MTEDQKIEFGIEIISGMKASAYGVSLEEGRLMALEDTEIDKCDYSEGEVPIEKVKKYCDRNREILLIQAKFISEIALNKLKEIGNNTTINSSKVDRMKMLKDGVDPSKIPSPFPTVGQNGL
jgi:hypothetical protein